MTALCVVQGHYQSVCLLNIQHVATPTNLVFICPKIVELSLPAQVCSLKYDVLHVSLNFPSTLFTLN